jgi:PAS domain S-box-containing protein
MGMKELDRMRLLKSVFAASPDIITVTSLKSGTIIEVNEEFEAQTGYTRDSVLGRSSIALEMWPDTVRRDEYQAKLLLEGVVRNFSARLKIYSGEIRLYQLSASIVEMGDDPTIVTIFRDVTEASKAEEKLRKGAFLLERAEEMAKIGSWEFDYATKAVTGSEGATRIYGVPQENLSVATMETVPLPEYRPLLNKARDEHITLGMPYDIEFKIRRQTDGTVLDIHSRALWDSVNRRLFGIIRDITDEKRTEAGLKGAIADRDMLIRELYHRINNSLQTIIALISLEESRDSTITILDALPRITRRIKAIAEVHKSLYESKNFSRIDMGEFIPRLFAAVGSVYGHGKAIEFIPETEQVDLNIDAAVPCGIILVELLDNAMKHAYAPDCGGRATVAIRKDPDGLVEFTVSDNGQGLAFALDSLPESCLGIRLVQDIVVHQLKGSIALHNVHGCEYSIKFRDDQLPGRF